MPAFQPTGSSWRAAAGLSMTIALAVAGAAPVAAATFDEALCSVGEKASDAA